MEETTWPYIRILNVGEKIMVNDIKGYLQSRIVFFLMNIHNRYRTIYFARVCVCLIFIGPELTMTTVWTIYDRTFLQGGFGLVTRWLGVCGEAQRVHITTSGQES